MKQQFSHIIMVSLWVYSQDSSDWPVIDALPSYGRGRELPGKRHQSLIFGSNLTDVIITGRYCSFILHSIILLIFQYMTRYQSCSFQVLTVPLMAKVQFGGTGFTTILWIILDHPLLNWCTLQELLFPIWPLQIHHFGMSILYTAGSALTFLLPFVTETPSIEMVNLSCRMFLPN